MGRYEEIWGDMRRYGLRLGREVDQPLAIGEHLCPSQVKPSSAVHHLEVDQLLAQKEHLSISRAIGSLIWQD